MIKALISLVILSILVPVLFYFTKNPQTDLANNITGTKGSYKEFKLASTSLITSKVPSTWSIFLLPASVGFNGLPTYPTASVGREYVALGDNNWNQVDIYLVEGDLGSRVKDKLLNE